MKIRMFQILTIVLFFYLIGIGFYSMRPAVEKKTLRTSGALKALNLWTDQRAYPNNDIPVDKYFQAYEQQKFNLQKNDRDMPEPWQAIGPKNIGGRTVALAFNPQNPNTIYAGSASGGLWRSYTAGAGEQAWHRVATGYPVLGVSGIAIAPNDSNVIYIGTGEVYNYQNANIGVSNRITRGTYGIGILKTTDSGETWTKSLDWSYNQQKGVQDVDIDPNHPEVIWAATTDGAYKSTDAGVNWELKLPVIMAMNILIQPANSDTVLITCGNLFSNGHGIYRTIDGGESWTKMTTGLPANFGGKAILSYCRTQPDIIYASIGNGYTGDAGTWLCKSTNAGETWEIVNTLDYATYQGWYSHFVGVKPDDPDVIICGGIDLFKSNNGGVTLQKKSYWDHWYMGDVPVGGPEGPPDYSHADHHVIVYHPDQPDVIYFGNDGGVFRSTDGGETFEGCNGGYQSTQFYNGFSSSVNDSLLALGGMQDNASAIYEGSPAWRRVVGGDGCWTAIDAGNDNILYASAQSLYLVKSYDRGWSWNYVNVPNYGTSNFVSPYIVCQDNSQVIYAGRSYILKSTNGGGQWVRMNNNQPLNGMPILSLAVYALDNNYVYAGVIPNFSETNMYRSVNGGESWENISHTLPNRYPMDIAVDPVMPFTVYVVFSGFNSAHVFKSLNGGAVWEDITHELPDVPTNAIAIDPEFPQHLYVGNDLGVFASTNQGESWLAFSAGLPEVVIAMDVSISPQNRKLRVATHGNGVYERSLIGDNTVATDDNEEIENFVLKPNYPNPFQANTMIAYSLNKFTLVNIKIFNMAGQEVRSLLKNNYQDAGMHQVVWDGKNNNGKDAPAGNYLYRLITQNQTITRKMTLIR